ncbi:DUF881 domain-containing protein [Romboutsia maritimum]|uniref:DUF881 domain-containing protein n=1 Tax=Romboutsia maritimum TaxID=2020948 RepID=A0A371IVE4_9FIRM|nr:DUF881 domain-containing protein [Romboutsia maritimum]RDY24445.1 DUF881 domain-containing protein [Romboutsia maritimum]
MKKKYMLIILVSLILGILIGIVFRDYKANKNDYISKDDLIKKEKKVTSKSIKKLRKEKENLDSQIENLNKEYNDLDKVKKVQKLKEILSYTDVKGKGLTLKIDAIDEKTGNISNFIDYNKILINIINELKINGSKYISINEQRINQYSEVVLAGSHININSTPIAPPYEIKCIGDIEKLTNYMNKGSGYLKNIQSNYPIKVDLKINDDIVINKLAISNKLKYMEDEEDNIRGK